MTKTSPIDGLPPYAVAATAGFPKARLAEALAAMRPPGEIMTAETVKLIKASPLSFARGLVERMCDEAWRIERIHCEIDATGAGLIIYRVDAAGHLLTFAVRCSGLAPVERSGRIKDDELDFYSVLFDGVAERERILAETDEQARRVWKGRTDNTALGWTFANRSNRSFEYVIDALVRGEQPDPGVLAESGGYLIRNAGFYGNGRHGCRTWQSFAHDHPLSEPYHVDLVCLYLWRQVGFDLVEGIAQARNPDAARLDDAIKRYVGIGNSSGIGMVAALVRWPHWLSGFAFTRELALALVLTEPAPADTARLDQLAALLARAERYYVESDPTIDPAAEDRQAIAEELSTARGMVLAFREEAPRTAGERPMLELMRRMRARFSPAACEQIASLMLDASPELCRRLRPMVTAAMAQARDVQPEMPTEVLKALIERDYDWALGIDFSAPGARHYFWYRSEENGENRRGERAIDPGLPFETFVDVAGHIQALHARIAAAPGEWTTARYLVEFPDDVYLVSRIQTLQHLPYGEIRSNIIEATFRPSDLIQYYLAVLGMETTNPNNFRWVRGVFMQGAPLPEDILQGAHRDWTLPLRPDRAAVPHALAAG